MIGLLANVRVIAGAAGGAALMFAGLSLYDSMIDDPMVRRAAIAAYKAEIMAERARIEIERRNDDAELDQMSDFDLCVADLNRRGLPIGACDVLRRFREERAVTGGDGGGDPVGPRRGASGDR